MLRLIALGVLVLLGLCATAGPTLSQDARCAGVKEDGTARKPGDYKYMHDCLHGPYMDMYKSTKCDCFTGYCRPTIWQETVRGTEVMIDGYWYTFPESARRERGQIPKALWPYPAHVCAHPTGRTLQDGRPEQAIECVVINASG